MTEPNKQLKVIFLLLLLQLLPIIDSTNNTTSDDEDLLFDLPLPKPIQKSLHHPPPNSNPAKWYNAGKEAANSPSPSMQSLFSATYYFTAATHVQPHHPETWYNLAISLSSLASGFSDTATEVVVLCEALYAAQLADHLRNTDSSTAPSHVSTIIDILEDYDQDFPLLCEGLPKGKHQSLLSHAYALEIQGKHLEATRLLCSTSKLLTITPTQPEIKRGVFTANTARRVWITSKICGVVKLSKGIESNLLKTVKTSIDQHWLSKKIEIEHKLATSPIFESDSIAMRGGSKRYELQLPPTDPYTNPKLTASHFVKNLILLLMNSNEIELDTFSYVHSLPGSKHQPWHQDVKHLFEHHKQEEKNNKNKEDQDWKWEKSSLSSLSSSSFGIVAVVPLIDIGAKEGGTEFIVGSHHKPIGINGNFWKDITASQTSKTPSIQFHTELGDLILFDLNLWHRGTPNVSDRNRPILYMSYVRNWYNDPTNFKRPQSRAFDTMKGGKFVQKLFTRIDSKNYVQNLEQIILKMDGGKDILKTVKSEGNYVQRNVRI